MSEIKCQHDTEMQPRLHYTHNREEEREREEEGAQLVGRQTHQAAWRAGGQPKDKVIKKRQRRVAASVGTEMWPEYAGYCVLNYDFVLDSA